MACNFLALNGRVTLPLQSTGSFDAAWRQIHIYAPNTASVVLICYFCTISLHNGAVPHHTLSTFSYDYLCTCFFLILFSFIQTLCSPSFALNLLSMSRDLAPNGRQPIFRSSNASTRSVSRFVTSSPSSLRSSLSSAGKDVTDRLTDGITGCAMAVPPPKSNVPSQRSDNAKPSGSPRRSITVSKSECLNNDTRLLKEMSDRNRELKEALVY